VAYVGKAVALEKIFSIARYVNLGFLFRSKG